MNTRPDLDLDALRQRLETRASTLRVELRDDRAKLADARDDAGSVPDRTDEAERVIRAGVDDAEFQRDLAELDEVEAALTRLKDGRFGSCVDCAEPIATPRLIAQPWASRCLACQAKREVHARPVR